MHLHDVFGDNSAARRCCGSILPAKPLPPAPWSQSNASVHRPLPLGEDASNSGTASDRCLRADAAFFVLQAYICALDLRSCCIHQMHAGNSENTQKMCGRCMSLGHRDRRNCATEANQKYAEAAQAVTCVVFGRHPDTISRCAIRLPALPAAWPHLLLTSDHVIS